MRRLYGFEDEDFEEYEDFVIEADRVEAEEATVAESSVWIVTVDAVLARRRRRLLDSLTELPAEPIDDASERRLLGGGGENISAGFGLYTEESRDEVGRFGGGSLLAASICFSTALRP